MSSSNWGLPQLLFWRRECPMCHSVKFKEAESRWFDEFLRMFALRPIRCKFCWRRYYWFSLHAPVEG